MLQNIIVSDKVVLIYLWVSYIYIILLELACRDDQRQAPFERMASNPTDFFDPEYIPTGLHMKDPRSMKVDSLVTFFKHVAERESSHGISHAFKFKSVLSSRKKGTLLPARYKDDDNASISEPENVPVLSRRKKRNRNRAAQDILPLLNDTPDDTLPLSPSSETSRPVSETSRRPLTGLYTPGDTPAPDENNNNITIPAVNERILQLRSRLPLTPDGTPAHSPSPSAPRRSQRNNNNSSPLNPTTSKKKKQKKKRA
jgi:hypothetical protein